MTRINLRTVTTGAVFIALSIILTRLLSLSIGDSIRLSLGNLPIIMAGIWLGPVGGALVGGLADMLGSFLSGLGWYPPLTLPAMLMGVLAGLLRRVFLKRKPTFWLTGLIILGVNIVTQMLVKTYLLNTLYGTEFWPLLAVRAPVAAGISVAETVIVTLIIKKLGVFPEILNGKRKEKTRRAAKRPTYEDAVGYIKTAVGCKPGLERVSGLLHAMGDPQKKLIFVHIAGTNGKGSVAAMIYSVLKEQGYKAGLFTSPYIERINDCIEIAGRTMSDRELADSVARIRPLAEAMSERPTEFELLTCIALDFFSRKSCDIVVLECGMGGELDATNVIDAPALAVLTAMSIEHTAWLGQTMEDIAAAKAGIIKPGSRVVYYGENAEAERVFLAKAKKTGCDITKPDFDALSVAEHSLNGFEFSYKRFEKLFLPLTGCYELRNAALAIEAIDALNKSCALNISDASIRLGLRRVIWPARFQVLRRSPAFILDGAHNPQGMAETVKSIRELLPGEKPVFLMGVMGDKDVETMIDMLIPLAGGFFTVKPDNPRAMEADELARRIEARGITAVPCASVREGVSRTLAAAGSGAAVCVGSLYMAGEIISCYYEGV